MVFENAFCCSPLCVPSRVSFFTGQYPHRTGATSNGIQAHIQAGAWSFLDELKSRGYALGLAGKNHAFSDEYLGRNFCFREEYGHWGKTHGRLTETDRQVKHWLTAAGGPGNRLADGTLMEGLVETAMPFPERHCPTWRIAEDAGRFIGEQGHRPFFLHCSFPDPHFPNAVCEPYHSMYAPEQLELEAADIDWSGHPFAHYVQSQSSGFDCYGAAERKRILATYLGQISFIDTAVGAVVDALEGRGLLDRTLIVFTSDHGDFGGRYGLTGKTKGFQEVLIRIPLVMVIPGCPPGRRIGADVSNIDIMPTVGAVLGLRHPPKVQGRSFLALCAGRAQTHREAIFAEVGTAEPPPPPIPIPEFAAYNRERRARDGVFWFTEYTVRGRSAMIRQDGWKYCCYTGDQDELYELANDPYELRNLADHGEHAGKKAELRTALRKWSLESQ
jgi:arylsulfatase A-like enzyme